MPRATALVTLHCNNACIFCAQSQGVGPVGTLPDPTSAGVYEGLNGADPSRLSFTGGEPLLVDIDEQVRRARAAGYRRVGVQTNGRALALDPTLAPRLAAAGLTDLQLSLHGADARTHDYHTGIDGSFDHLLAAIASARAASLTIAVATVLTRSNFRNLAALPPLLRAHGVAAWLLELPRIAGRAEAQLDRVVPRLGLALPFALQAIEIARTLSLPAFIRGAPLCTLGPFATRNAPLEVDTPRAYPEARCGACAARPSCSGLDPIYLARYGDAELHPIPAPAPIPADPLLDLFPGVGPLAPATTPAAEIHPPPAEVRRHLPMLGKVQPAVAEVPRSQPKRTGEALREIFPDLFAEPTPAAKGDSDPR